MTAGVLGITVILTVLTGVRGTADAWMTENLLPKGLFGVSNMR